MTTEYDIIVIGGGPAGYVASIRAAQLGFSVACCESRPSLGGTCLNVGCIPSKALLESSSLYHKIESMAESHGIQAKPSLKFSHMMQRKNKIVNKLCNGIDFLFKKHKITKLHGSANLKDSSTVILDGGSSPSITAKKAVIIATGSKPSKIPNLDFDEKNILSSTGALELKKVPTDMIIAGGGVIGLEIGSVYKRLGTKITVVEFLETITPGMDKELTKAFFKILNKQGFEFILGHKITQAKNNKNSVEITISEANNEDKSQTLKSEKLLVAIGRVPQTEGLELDKVGIETDNRGFIKVGKDFQTSCAGVYAIGDCIGGLMLAHKAEEEAISLIESLAGQKGHVDYRSIPSIIYTEPEVAFVGESEESLIEKGIGFNKGKASFQANGRAMAMESHEGFAKILACDKTDTILGAQIIAPEAGNLIHEVTAIMAYNGSSQDLARCNHAHPTLNETVKEAAKKISKSSISA